MSTTNACSACAGTRVSGCSCTPRNVYASAPRRCLPRGCEPPAQTKCRPSTSALTRPPTYAHSRPSPSRDEFSKNAMGTEVHLAINADHTLRVSENIVAVTGPAGAAQDGQRPRAHRQCAPGTRAASPAQAPATSSVAARGRNLSSSRSTASSVTSCSSGRLRVPAARSPVLPQEFRADLANVLPAPHQ